METLPANIKKNVNDTLAAIKAKMNKMEEKNQSGNKTSGLFHWNGRKGVTSELQNAIKINNCNEIALLLSILGFLITRKTEYDLAAETLEIKTYPAFAWSGFSLEDWQHDIDIRISVIMHSEEVKKLQEAERFLSQYVSTEDKVAEMLSNINAMLK